MRNFFILGCPRSGTTLLHVMLGRHRNVLVSPETKLFYYYNRAPKWLAQRALRRIEADLGIAINGLRNDGSLVPVSRVFELIAEQYRIEVNKPEATVFGEKTPEHSCCVHEMLSCFPDAKFLVMVRDGRDVAESLTRVPWINCDLLAGISVWRRYAKQLNRWRAHPQFMFIQFEQLVREPAKVMQNVREHLELLPDSNVVYGKGDECRSIPNRELQWKNMALKPPSSSRAFQWQRTMHPIDVFRLESLAKDELEAFDYPVVNHNPKPSLWLRTQVLVSVTRMVLRLPCDCLVAELLAACDRSSA